MVRVSGELIRSLGAAPPMEAKAAAALPRRDWWFDPKWDGFRCLVEEHFVTPEVLAAWRALDPRWQDVALKHSDRGETGEKLRDLGDRRLADMDATGLDAQVLSLTAPGVQSLDPGEAGAPPMT